MNRLSRAVAESRGTFKWLSVRSGRGEIAESLDEEVCESIYGNYLHDRVEGTLSDELRCADESATD